MQMDEEEHGSPEDAGARILVVDDEEIIQVSLGRTLGRQGHQVEAVGAAATALEQLASRRFDLVITDLMMPKMNGIELMERLQGQDQTTPVLMITGYPTIRTAVQALRLGAIDYLTKPFTRSELMGPVNRALRRAPRARPAPEPEAPEDADGIVEPQVDLAPGDRFCLRDHSWAVFQQDGTMQIGIEASFLDTLGAVTGVELPFESDLIEQGFVGFRLKTQAQEEHSVFMPLSGQVLEVNATARDDPSCIHDDTWLVRILPTRLESEIPLLLQTE